MRVNYRQLTLLIYRVKLFLQHWSLSICHSQFSEESSSGKMNWRNYTLQLKLMIFFGITSHKKCPVTDGLLPGKYILRLSHPPHSSLLIKGSHYRIRSRPRTTESSCGATSYLWPAENKDFTEARDSGWQWHQLGHMQVCTSLQTDNHAAPYHSVFYRPDALPVAKPTASKHWRHCLLD